MQLLLCKHSLLQSAGWEEALALPSGQEIERKFTSSACYNCVYFPMRKKGVQPKVLICRIYPTGTHSAGGCEFLTSLCGCSLKLQILTCLVLTRLRSFPLHSLHSVEAPEYCSNRSKTGCHFYLLILPLLCSEFCGSGCIHSVSCLYYPKVKSIFRRQVFSLICQDIFIRKVLSFTVFLATDIAQFYDSCQNQMRQRLTLTQGLEAWTKPPPLLTHNVLKGQIEFQPLH